MEQLFNEIRQSFLDYEDEQLLERISSALEKGADPVEIIALLSGALENIGEQFSKGEMFLPDMVLAGAQMEACMDVLRPVSYTHLDVYKRQLSFCKLIATQF